MGSPVKVPSTVLAAAKRAVNQGGLPHPVEVNLALAEFWVESGFNPLAVGDMDLAPAAGPSFGLGQIDVGTNVRPHMRDVGSITDLLNADNNADLAVRLLSEHLFEYNGDVSKAMSAYNAGHATDANKGYVDSVLGMKARLDQDGIEEVQDGPYKILPNLDAIWGTTLEMQKVKAVTVEGKEYPIQTEAQYIRDEIVHIKDILGIN